MTSRPTSAPSATRSSSAASPIPGRTASRDVRNACCIWLVPSWKKKQPIIGDIEAKFEFLMEKLGVFGTRAVIEKYVPLRSADMPAYAAASEALTAAATVDPNEGE